MKGVLSRFKWPVILIVIVVTIITVAFGWLSYHHRLRKVADIPGPAASGVRYELWYGNHGDLELRPGTPGPVASFVVFRDYYASTEVQDVVWTQADRVAITMRDGMKIEIAVGSGVCPATAP